MSINFAPCSTGRISPIFLQSDVAAKWAQKSFYTAWTHRGRLERPVLAWSVQVVAWPYIGNLSGARDLQPNRLGMGKDATEHWR